MMVKISTEFPVFGASIDKSYDLTKRFKKIKTFSGLNSNKCNGWCGSSLNCNIILQQK
jgi:hypothetical protein